MRAWIGRVPASFFGMVLGLVGLGSGWRTATALWGAPAWIGEAVMAAGVCTWAVLAALYAAKWLMVPGVARNETAHPIQCCFVGLVPGATMLAGIALAPHARDIAVALAVIGGVGQLGFSTWRTGDLWRGDREHDATTPVLYLPTVAGSFIAAIAAAAFGDMQIGRMCLGAGVFSWFAVESVLLHRLYTRPAMAVALRPTLGIQLAPPVVACAAYLANTAGPPDIFALALLGYGLLQVAVLIRLVPWITAQRYLPAYWGFTFGAGAIAADAMRLVQRGAGGIMPALSTVLFAADNVLVVGLALGTLWLLLRGRVLPPVPAAAPSPPPAVPLPAQ